MYFRIRVSTSIREACEKIQNLERRVYAANTQVDLANEFSDLLAVPASPDSSTIGEIIIIVLSFLLFIIPGIIFLIIFC